MVTCLSVRGSPVPTEVATYDQVYLVPWTAVNGFATLPTL